MLKLNASKIVGIEAEKAVSFEIFKDIQNDLNIPMRGMKVLRLWNPIQLKNCKK